MTKWFPSVDAAINTVTDAIRDSPLIQDLINVWDGDAVDNLISQDLEGDNRLAETITGELEAKEDLPDWAADLILSLIHI